MARVRIAQETDRPHVVSAIVAGFISDPAARWCWPEASAYMANMPRFVEAYGGRAFAADSAWTDEGLVGGALWLPPGTAPDESELAALVTSTMSTERQGHLFAVLEQLGGYHPDEPHWFLPLIAVDPVAQGQGMGSRLMRAALEKVDETGMPAYLESSNPRNISLYQRHGFKVMGEVRAGDSPVFTPMVRERASRTG